MCNKLKNYVKYGIIKDVTRCGKYLKIIIKGKYKGGLKMPKNKKLYEIVEMTCADLKLPDYPKLLLINMVYRKIKHPEEKTDEIMAKVIKTTVPELYKKQKKKAYMQVSANKELGMLERELHECENLPEELLNGKVIANTVKYYAKKIIDEN